MPDFVMQTSFSEFIAALTWFDFTLIFVLFAQEIKKGW